MKSRRIRFLLSGSILVVLVGILIPVLGTGWKVFRAIHPARVQEAPGELLSAVLPIEEVTFLSTDGVSLSGWLMRGREGRPAVILCHDLGGDRNSVIYLAAPLLEAGFTVLAFDFRGHGASGGTGTGLGVEERFDVQGAIRFLSEPAADRPPVREIGVYGIGMGAHAAVLAVENPRFVRALVLEALYPDPAFRLDRELFGDWNTGKELLGPIGRFWYSILARAPIGAYTARERLPHLTGIDILLIAPAGDSRLAKRMQAMFETIPEQVDQDGNLVTLPSMEAGTLFGQNLEVHRAGIVSYLTQRLPAGFAL